MQRHNKSLIPEEHDCTDWCKQPCLPWPECLDPDKSQFKDAWPSSQENRAVGAEVDFKDPEPGIHHFINLDIDLQVCHWF